MTATDDRREAAMVLLTYTPGPAARTGAYEEWLRREDNPTFNRIPGIDDYSNWKVVAPDPVALPWSHFDFLGIAGPESVEQVWFNPELDRFRKGWVAKWGYGATGGPPTEVNGNGHLCLSAGPRIRAQSRYVVIDLLDSPPSGEPAIWRVAAAMRKHYAIGAPPEGIPWRRDVRDYNPLGWSALRVTPAAAEPAGPWSATRLLAECIAAPWLGEKV